MATVTLPEVYAAVDGETATQFLPTLGKSEHITLAQVWYFSKPRKKCGIFFQTLEKNG